MGINTDIEWCDSTVNPTTGCEGCELWAGQVRTCYAGNYHETRLAKAIPTLYAADFTEVRLAPGRMEKAAAWSDLTGTERPHKPWLNGMPRTIFVGDMGDVFSRQVPDFYLREIMRVMDSEAGRRHIWMLLTKQPQRMVELAKQLIRWPSHVWAGVSVTSQITASRLNYLRNVPALYRFISVEPLLGPIEFYGDGLWCSVCRFCAEQAPDPETNVVECRRCDSTGIGDECFVDWMIIGGESGPGARSCNVESVRGLLEQGQIARVPCFVKQLGSVCAILDSSDSKSKFSCHSFRSITGSTLIRVKLNDKKGGDPSEWPEDLRVREFPMMEASP